MCVNTTAHTTYCVTLNGANDMSAEPLTRSPTIPFHSTESKASHSKHVRIIDFLLHFRLASIGSQYLVLKFRAAALPQTHTHARTRMAFQIRQIGTQAAAHRIDVDGKN